MRSKYQAQAWLLLKSFSIRNEEFRTISTPISVPFSTYISTKFTVLAMEGPRLVICEVISYRTEIQVPLHRCSLRCVQWRSQPKNSGGVKMLDFRQITLFCLEYRLSKHKMTICSENSGGMAP